MSTTHQRETLTLLRRARDAMDRDYASPLDVPTVAARAHMTPAHFSRLFKAAYGETPHGYLMTRRIERAMALLRGGSSVTDACHAVGYTSVSSFSTCFTRLTGESPSSFRSRDHGAWAAMPSCLVRILSRPCAPRVTHRAGFEKSAEVSLPTVSA